MERHLNPRLICSFLFLPLFLPLSHSFFHPRKKKIKRQTVLSDVIVYGHVLLVAAFVGYILWIILGRMGLKNKDH